MDQVRLAGFAAATFSLAALIEIIILIRGWSKAWLATCVAMTVAAVIWWIVFFRWKRQVER